jgi:hypothetical protein
MPLSMGLLASFALGACSLDQRKVSPRDEPLLLHDAGGANGTMMGPGAVSQPGQLGLDAGTPGLQPGREGEPPVEGLQPGEVVSGPGSASCGDGGGACPAAADAGINVACIPTGARDCTSALDNDCDGSPDNTLDSVCVCAAESSELCDAHPGLDGRGQCRAGSRSCVLGPGNATSSWGSCEGSVAPGQQDSCAVDGDDTNCDGINNGGCPCIEGEARPCGPSTDNGICQRGTQTCVDGAFGQCVGAVFPAARDCGSQADNDCDGVPDNTVDTVCTCVIGAVQACGTHPGRDGNGQCRAGSQTCEGRANDTTSTFGACVGSVGPALSDTCAPDDDSNCNGLLNEGCACLNGQTRPCGPDTELGSCQRGVQTCANGAFGQCVGAVFPAPRDCDSTADDDCDGRPDNTFDNVCLAPQNPFSCSNADPPATVLPFNLFPVDPATGGPIFPLGAPPVATGGSIGNGRYEPTRIDVYGQAEVPTFVVNELTFEFLDGFVQVSYQGFVGTGAVLGSAEIAFVGTATPRGSSLELDVEACAPAGSCSTFETVACSVPTSLPYSATASGLVTIQPASDGSTVVTTYSRQ